MNKRQRKKLLTDKTWSFDPVIWENLLFRKGKFRRKPYERALIREGKIKVSRVDLPMTYKQLHKHIGKITD